MKRWKWRVKVGDAVWVFVYIEGLHHAEWVKGLVTSQTSSKAAFDFAWPAYTTEGYELGYFVLINDGRMIYRPDRACYRWSKGQPYALRR
jgi:hypothetical protein